MAEAVDWNQISATPGLSEEYMDQNAGMLNWKEISRNQYFSAPFISHHADRMDWLGLISNRQIDNIVRQQFIPEISNYINSCPDVELDSYARGWLIDKCDLSEAVLERYADQMDDIDWNMTSYQKLSEEFIERYADKLNWRAISERQKLSEAFIERFADKVSWSYISAYQKLSEKFIERHADKVNWSYISAYQKLSKEFMERHGDKLDWAAMSSSQILPEDLMQRYSHKLNWGEISARQKLSEPFMQHNSDRIKWSTISRFQKLSGEFMERNADKLNWRLISRHQTLSDDFLDRNSKRIDWQEFFEGHKVSEEFLERHIDKFDKGAWAKICRTQELSNEFIKKHSKEVNWAEISVHQKLSVDFMKQNSRKLYWGLMSRNQVLPEELIMRNSRKVNWADISECQTLSENFMERNFRKLDKLSLARHQTLSEEFIEKHLNKLDLRVVCANQALPASFVEKHSNEIDMNNVISIIKNKKTPDETIKFLSGRINSIMENYKYFLDKEEWQRLYQNIELSEKVKKNYRRKIDDVIDKDTIAFRYTQSVGTSENQTLQEHHIEKENREANTQSASTSENQTVQEHHVEKGNREAVFPELKESFIGKQSEALVWNEKTQQFIDSISEKTKNQFKALYGLDLDKVLTSNQEVFNQLSNNLPCNINPKMPNGEYIHISQFAPAGKDEYGKNQYNITANTLNVVESIGEDGSPRIDCVRDRIEDNDLFYAHLNQIDDQEVIDHIRTTGRSDMPVEITLPGDEAKTEECVLYFDPYRNRLRSDETVNVHALIPVPCSQIEKHMNRSLELQDDQGNSYSVKVKDISVNEDGDRMLTLSFTGKEEMTGNKFTSEVEVPYIKSGEDHTCFERDGEPVALAFDFKEIGTVTLSKAQVDYLGCISTRTNEAGETVVTMFKDIKKAIGIMSDGRDYKVDTADSPSFKLPVSGPMCNCTDSDARHVGFNPFKLSGGSNSGYSTVKNHQEEKNKVAMEFGRAKSNAMKKNENKEQSRKSEHKFRM